MSAIIYTQKDCPMCRRFLAYLYCRYKEDGVTVCDASDIDAIPDKEMRVIVRRDLAWQNDSLPLVYIDGVYQEYEDMAKKVISWEMARRQSEHCKADFLV